MPIIGLVTVPSGDTALRYLVGSTVSEEGFTIVEVLTVLAFLILVTALGASKLRDHRDGAIVREAAGLITADIAVARGAAMKLGRNVSIVANEEALRYVVRDSYGTELRSVRSFGPAAHLSLHALDFSPPGDSLIFDSLGMVISAKEPRIRVRRANRSLRVELNGLGRPLIVHDER